MCQEWFAVDKDILVGTTENGWTSETMCSSWFETTFIPAAKAHGDSTKPIVLLFDGHSSHATKEMIDIADRNNIILFELPPHTTHRLQPCDVGVFSPLKREWNKRAQAVFDETGVPLQARDVVRVYWDARQEALKENTIRQAFTKSGLVHVQDETGSRLHCDINQFTANDFAPSIPTSTISHVPEGYPTHQTNASATSSRSIDSSIRIVSAAATTAEETRLDTALWDREAGSDDSSEDGSDDEIGVREDAGTDTNQNDITAMQLMPESSRRPSSPNPFLTHTTSLAVASRSRPCTRSEVRNAARTAATSPASVECIDDESDDEAHLEHANTPRSLRRLVDKRTRELRQAQTKLEEATAHAVLMQSMVGDLKNQLNTKRNKKKSGRRDINIGGRVVTSEEGRAIALAQQQAREEKENKAEEMRKKKLLADAAQLQRREELGREGMLFIGAFAQQKRPILQDIAWCMGLPEMGTREELMKRIGAHLEQHPGLRNDSRFTGLWPAKRGTKRSAGADITYTASSSCELRSPKRAHIDDVSNIPMELVDGGSGGVVV